MGLKESLLNKIEKHAVKTTLEGEVVYLKKSSMPLIGDWGRIYPPVNEDGSWNILNLVFGGKRNFIKLVLILILIGFVLLGFYEVFTQYNTLADQPCVKTCIDLAKNMNIGVLK